MRFYLVTGVGAVAGVRQENDAGLQPFGLVQVHEPDDIIPARLQGHLLHLELLFFDQITQLRQHLTPVQ